MEAVRGCGAETVVRWLVEHGTGVYGCGGGDLCAVGLGGEFVVLHDAGGSISVGVYRDQDAYRAGDALRLRRWDTDTGEAIAEAVESLRYWCGVEATSRVEGQS